MRLSYHAFMKQIIKMLWSILFQHFNHSTWKFWIQKSLWCIQERLFTEINWCESQEIYLAEKMAYHQDIINFIPLIFGRSNLIDDTVKCTTLQNGKEARGCYK